MTTLEDSPDVHTCVAPRRKVPPSPTVARLRARHASLTKLPNRAADVAPARTDLAIEVAAEHLERLAELESPPTARQLARLRSLLGGGA